MRARNGTRRASRADVDRAPPILIVENQYEVFVFPLDMACLVVDDAKCVAGMGCGAHPARTSEVNPSGGAILPVKNHAKSTCFFSACTFLSSALRNSWQEWDAVHIARDMAKCRSRFGAARMFSESCAPAQARRTFSACQFCERMEPPGASQGFLEHPGASPGLRGSSWSLLRHPGASWDSLGLPEIWAS